MLFESIGIVRDSSGSPIETQSTQSLSQLFAMAMKHEELVHEMVQKARAQDRRNRDRMKQFKNYRNVEEFDHEAASEGSISGSEPKSPVSPHLDKSLASPTDLDSLAGVDIQFRFYNVPRYVGLIQSKNVDFFRDESEDILVNDDLQEDLLRVCQIFKLIDSLV